MPLDAEPPPEPPAEPPTLSARGHEHHLASLLLHVRPDRRAAVRAAVAAMPGVEIHIEEQGKMVVTVEGPHEGWIADRMTSLHLMDGVLSAVMVFHHLETVAETAPPLA